MVIKDKKSDTKKLRDISVCQGASFGPDSFNLYINDLPYNTKFTTFLFADDTNLLDSDSSLEKLEARANLEIDKFYEIFFWHKCCIFGFCMSLKAQNCFNILRAQEKTCIFLAFDIARCKLIVV